MTGIVKWFNDQKGYGFIVPEDKSPDVYVHYTGIQTQMFRTLKDGERVEFDIEKGEKGPRAVKVRRLGDGCTESPAS